MIHPGEKRHVWTGEIHAETGKQMVPGDRKPSRGCGGKGGSARGSQGLRWGACARGDTEASQVQGKPSSVSTHSVPAPDRPTRRRQSSSRGYLGQEPREQAGQDERVRVNGRPAMPPGRQGLLEGATWAREAENLEGRCQFWDTAGNRQPAKERDSRGGGKPSVPATRRCGGLAQQGKQVCLGTR